MTRLNSNDVGAVHHIGDICGFVVPGLKRFRRVVSQVALWLQGHESSGDLS